MSIRVITEPSVYLVGRLTIDETELDCFLADEGVESWTTDTENAGQKLVEVAGRLCYKSYAKPRPGGNAAYIGHILEVGHGSVIEHAVYNFVITGVSRSFTHELVRHRAGWAYSQRSQRFCDESDFSAVMPPLIRDLIDWDEVPASDPEMSGPDELWEEWTNAIESARDAYERIASLVSARLVVRNLPPEIWHDGQGPESCVELNDAIASLGGDLRTSFRKRSREAARSVLPNAAETQIFVTANARALRHFIEARGDEHADAEIRSVALKMLAILQSESPNLFGDYRVDPVRYVTTPFKKV